MKLYVIIQYGRIPFIRRDEANDYRVFFRIVKAISGS